MWVQLSRRWQKIMTTDFKGTKLLNSIQLLDTFGQTIRLKRTKPTELVKPLVKVLVLVCQIVIVIIKI